MIIIEWLLEIDGLLTHGLKNILEAQSTTLEPREWTIFHLFQIERK